ncbi:hypothetical protein EVAR_73136_1 [Eumeta japonica]|uniref:PH domain-containing protein n=1 Tax=Eumeta variegata TaxID=151549 RepID=A0A4C1SRW8_EUMVA|nr:hypothetical protein EVAR_73136_1 [Eumeta japonica]
MFLRFTAYGIFGEASRTRTCTVNKIIIRSDVRDAVALRPRRVQPSCVGTDGYSASDKTDGLEVMLSVPKKANDTMHLSLLEGCDVPTDNLGEVVLQDSFHVWDSRQLIRKGRERRAFLFDLYLLLAKEVKDSHGKAKYIYKSKLMTSDLGVTEHIEGDSTKFAVWPGRAPMSSDYRIVLKAPSLEVKQTWVRRLREVIQETYFSGAMAGLQAPRSSARVRPTSSQRSSRDLDDTILDETNENVDRNSLASFGSGNTTDSDKDSTSKRLSTDSRRLIIRSHPTADSRKDGQRKFKVLVSVFLSVSRWHCSTCILFHRRGWNVTSEKCVYRFGVIGPRLGQSRPDPIPYSHGI